jgi:hypothetical protein
VFRARNQNAKVGYKSVEDPRRQVPTIFQFIYYYDVGDLLLAVASSRSEELVGAYERKWM